MIAWMEHFEHWPKDATICCLAETAHLASMLLLAHLHNRSVHICHVSRKDEIEVIKAAKQKGIKVLNPPQKYLRLKFF